MYEVIFSNKAQRQLEKLDKQTQKRIISVLERVRIRPEDFLQKLVGSNSHKIRAGDYRAIADLDLKEKKIVVLIIGHRKNVYDKLDF